MTLRERLRGLGGPRGERLGLALILGLAAVLRLPGLDGRGRFEFDQGQDMLVLRAFVEQGVIPLLGPRTSVGDFHHGALEYFLLAPAAWLSGAQPLAVTLEFTLIGIAAVAATWWAGRVIGGSTVGLLAGLLLAVSPAGVDESIFIWNPNPVPLFAAISVGAAWRAHQAGRARWWALALAAAAAVANLHILGAVFVVPIAALLVADLVTAHRSGDGRRARAALHGGAAGLGAAVVIYLPLIVSELQTGFAETRSIAAYLASGAGGASASPLARLLVIALRSIDWPFVGLITDVPALAALVIAVVLALVAWVAVAGPGAPASAGRWLAASIAWSIGALAIVAPTLATVVTVLPNDHYHSFLDPVVLIAFSLAVVALARGPVNPARAGSTAGVASAARVILGMLVLATVAVALLRQPQPDPNGGWPAARSAGDRIVAALGPPTTTTGAPKVAVLNLPNFEPPTWISYPIVYAAGSTAILTDEPATGDYVVLGCDRAFEVRIGAACGGPADRAWLPKLAGSLAERLELVERFDLSARISVAVYRVGIPPG